MEYFKFTAKAHVTMTVSAENEAFARALIFGDLQDADTDFIRSDHFSEKAICAEFHLSDVEPAQ